MTEHHDDDYEIVILPRDGDRAIRGRMRLVGEGQSGTGGQFRSDWNRGWTVLIYARERGGWAVRRERWSSWQGERGSSEAWLAETPEALYRSLRGETGMGRAEQAAWEDAIRYDDRLATVAYEEA